MQETAEFWDNVWGNFTPFYLERNTFGQEFQQFFELIGNVKGKDVLELGCGNGELSVLLAKNGAQVTAIDYADTSIQNVRTLAEFNGVSVEAFSFDAMKLGELNKEFDLVIGKFILHHIEPFSEFAKVLYKVIKQGGKGVFYENSSRNKFLMFCRHNLVGKFWIPKYGDNEEYPFEPSEIKILEKTFNDVSLYYPEFRFFKMLGPYIFKHNEFASNIFNNIDNYIYKHFKGLHKYSYYQIIELTK